MEHLLVRVAGICPPALSTQQLIVKLKKGLNVQLPGPHAESEPPASPRDDKKRLEHWKMMPL